MDDLAWHDNPVEASDFFIRIDLADHGMPGHFEQLWVTRVDDKVFRVCCLPFFAYGIAFGDTVETDDEFTFKRIVSKSGHQILRVAVANKKEEVQLHSTLHEWVEQTGLPHEWYSRGYLSVDLPPHSNQVKNLQLLERLEQNGDIAFEIVA